jgi:nucleotide-binding universal stress UspA family protein
MMPIAQTPRRILVGHDLSERADRALARALQLACNPADVTVVHVADRQDGVTDVQGRLVARTATLRGPGIADQPELRVKVGDAAEVLAIEATASDADLLVLGLHNKLGLLDLIMGTTSARTIQGVRVPVLVAVTTPPDPYKRVLVGIDYAETSASALRLAAAWFHSADIAVMHAFDLKLRRGMPGPITLGDLDESRLRWMKDFVERTVTDASARTIPSSACLLKHGPPDEALRATVTQQRADLIVVGTHSRPPLAQALLGSVTRNLLSAPPCDVLVVPRTM